MSLKTNAISHQKPIRPLYKMGLLFLMYLSQKIFLCFSWTVLPILLRKQGVSLGTIGFTALVYSPWALKFLYAALVDRFYSPRMGRRKSWITPLLLISGGILPFLSLLSPAQDLGLILVAVFMMNLIFATTDIAVDAYATDILLDSERPLGNTVQMVAYMTGYMMGAGVFLVTYQDAGWRVTLMVIAALQLFFMLPIVSHREIPPVPPKRGSYPAGPGKKPPGPGAWAFLIQPATLWFLLFASLTVVVDRGGSQLYLPMFIDKGVDPAGLGLVNIWAGAPLSILGSILGGLLLPRLGVRKVFAIGCLGATGISFFAAAVSRGLSPGFWAIGILLGMDKLVAGIVFVLIYSLVMRFSAGPRSATHYAVLCSLPHLCGLLMMPLIGNLCDVVGYVKLYQILGAFGLMVLFGGDYVLCRRLKLVTGSPEMDVGKGEVDAKLY